MFVINISHPLIISSIVLCALVAIIPWVLAAVYKDRDKKPAVLLTAAFFLIVVGSLLSYLFTELQESSKKYKVQVTKEVLVLEKQISLLGINSNSTLKEQLHRKLEEKSYTVNFDQLVSFLNLFVIFVGLSVAANYIAQATTNIQSTNNIYDVPIELYRKIDKIESNQKLIINMLLILMFLILIQIVLS